MMYKFWITSFLFLHIKTKVGIIENVNSLIEVETSVCCLPLPFKNYEVSFIRRRIVGYFFLLNRLIDY